jgi:D-threo-aldose 1-dehydrogenase
MIPTILATTVATTLFIKRAQQTTASTASPPHTPKHKTKRRINENLNVTVLGMGGASLGDLYIKITNIQAVKTLEAAYNRDINFYDTSPWYGVGLSEARFGLTLHDVPRNSFILQTKVGRYLIPDRKCQNGIPVGWIGGFHFNIQFDYSANAFKRQIEDSIQRMGLGYIDSIVIHDLEPTCRVGINYNEKTNLAKSDLTILLDSGYDYLIEQRHLGNIKAFGAGLNSNEGNEDLTLKREWNKYYVQQLLQLHKKGKSIDFLLLANMFSLLNFEAFEDGILDICLKNDISVIIGGPYSSGILATGPDPSNGSIPYYNYSKASDSIRQRCRKIEKICNSFSVPLIAAAIQFPLLHPSVVSVIPGGKNEWEVNSNVDNMNIEIPNDLWKELKKNHLLPKNLKLPFET